jgi:hypothetical protein
VRCLQDRPRCHHHLIRTSHHIIIITTSQSITVAECEPTAGVVRIADDSPRPVRRRRPTLRPRALPAARQGAAPWTPGRRRGRAKAPPPDLSRACSAARAWCGCGLLAQRERTPQQRQRDHTDLQRCACCVPACAQDLHFKTCDWKCSTERPVSEDVLRGGHLCTRAAASRPPALAPSTAMRPALLTPANTRQDCCSVSPAHINVDTRVAAIL